VAAASLVVAFANSLPWLFAARLVQGAADAVTWVVGFALIADLYDANERGRVTGLVMMGTSAAFMIGPTFGGWLYELGGMRMPFIAVAVLAALDVVLFSLLDVPSRHAESEHVSFRTVLRVPTIAVCALVVVGISATLSMLEPVLALHLSGLGVSPARLGLIYGVAAVVTTTLNPITGHLSDRVGARRLTMIGLLMMAAMIPILGQAWSYRSALALFVLTAAAGTFVITPSLAYMGEATSDAGVRSFGIAYGLYNLAWGMGLLSGPALGGFLFEHMGFAPLTVMWAPILIVVRYLLGRVEASRSPSEETL
jgi:predicted MFS family arabinose efflux permease